VGSEKGKRWIESLTFETIELRQTPLTGKREGTTKEEKRRNSAGAEE